MPITATKALRLLLHQLPRITFGGIGSSPRRRGGCRSRGNGRSSRGGRLYGRGARSGRARSVGRTSTRSTARNLLRRKPLVTQVAVCRHTPMMLHHFNRQVGNFRAMRRGRISVDEARLRPHVRDRGFSLAPTRSARGSRRNVDASRDGLELRASSHARRLGEPVSRRRATRPILSVSCTTTPTRLGVFPLPTGGIQRGEAPTGQKPRALASL